MTTLTAHIIDIAVAILAFFIISCIIKGKLLVVQKLYLFSAICLLIWLIAINGMTITNSLGSLQVLDAITCACSALMVVTILMTSITYTKNLVKIPRCYWLIYVLPVIEPASPSVL